MQTMQHCCCLISNLNDTRGCIHPLRPAVRTRHTNRLNPGNNRGIRNVPLPNTSMLDKYAQSIEHAASPAGRPSHCHTGNDVTAPSMRADRLLREAAGARFVLSERQSGHYHYCLLSSSVLRTRGANLGQIWHP